MDQGQPTTIGKYEILSVIGRGGMGVVYRARDPLMGRPVAIKTLTEGFSNDASMLKRFRGEAEKMGKLRHPNIITVYDLGEQNGLPFIVMELVEGDPLDRLIQSGQSVPLHTKLRIIEQVCEALAYAHQNNVIHRDVKPGNVIVRPDGVAKLLDFGIARQEKSNLDHTLTAIGGVIGTVPYMAPERLKGAPFDGRSDIFAAGVLLFQVLTGVLPFAGSEFVLVNQLLNDKHPSLSHYLADYPPALDAILDRALAKDPMDRYQIADEMAADLYSVTEGLEHKSCVGLMELAQRLASEGEYVGAQDALFRLLKVDNKNTQARAMAKEIGLRVTNKARALLAEQNRRDAEDALRDRKFEDAVRLLEKALNLVPDDVTIASQLESARTKKQTNDQIFGYLQQADAARNCGDFTGARAIIEKAIELDTSNSRLRAAYQSLAHQAEDAARQAKVKQLLNAAREALQRRNYEDVLDLVNQAQAMDPENYETKEIERAARAGISQEQRRRLLEDIEDQISAIITREDAERTALIIQEELKKTTTDATLLRYQAQIGRIVREHRNKSLVNETLKECSIAIETAPLEALEKVRKSLLTVPGDPRLVAIEGRIKQRIEHMTAEEARAAILLQAEEFLKQRSFSRAVYILQNCKSSILTPEISELLTYARQEAAEQERQQFVTRLYAEAQVLHREGKYEDLIILLGPVAQRSGDLSLQNMLGEANRALERREAEEAAALDLIKPLADAECHEQVVALSQLHLSEHPGSAAIRALQTASQKAWSSEYIHFESAGAAYSALDSGDWELASWDPSPANDSASVSEIRKLLSGHRTQAVDRILTDQVKHIHKLTASGAQIDAATELDKNKRLLTYASDGVKAEWNLLANRYQKSGKIQRAAAQLGKWKSRTKEM